LDVEEFKTKLKKLFEAEYFKNIGNNGDNSSPKTLTSLKGMIFKKESRSLITKSKNILIRQKLKIVFVPSLGGGQMNIFFQI
jgi:hypothetical protein